MALRKHFRMLVNTIKAAQLFSGSSKLSKEEIKAWKKDMKEKAMEKKKKKPAKPILRSYSQAKMSTMDELKGASIKDIIRHKSVRKTKPTLESVAGLLKDVLKEVG